MPLVIAQMKLWWPGVIRAAILCTLAYLVAFDTSFDQMVAKIVQADTSKWTRMEWIAVLYPMFGKPCLAALLALKAFMDDTWGKLKQTSDTQIFVK